MAIDEELISLSNQEKSEADNSESDAFDSDMGEDFGGESATEEMDDEDSEEDDGEESSSLRQEVQKAKNGIAFESTGDLRRDRMIAQRMREDKEKDGEKNKAAKKSVNMAAIDIAKLLQAAWKNIITSWGLTLIWIDIHYMLSYVFGKDLFCDLGYEWQMHQVFSAKPESGITAKKIADRDARSVSVVEKMGCACLNMGCLLLVIAIASVIAMIVSAISNPIQTSVSVLGDLLCAAVGGCK